MVCVSVLAVVKHTVFDIRHGVFHNFCDTINESVKVNEYIMYF